MATIIRVVQSNSVGVTVLADMSVCFPGTQVAVFVERDGRDLEFTDPNTNTSMVIDEMNDARFDEWEAICELVYATPEWLQD